MCGTRYGEGEDGVGVAVAVTRVRQSAAVSARPNVNRALALPSARHSVDEGPARQWSRSVHGHAVVFRAPGRAVDIDVVGVEAQRLRFDRIVYTSVQHPDACKVECGGGNSFKVGFELFRFASLAKGGRRGWPGKPYARLRRLNSLPNP